MKAEAENSFMSDNDEMTPAEIAYISAMEDVKDLSKKLVIAEKAFQLVRDRIENLISKYEEMLVKLETETLESDSIESDSFLDYDQKMRSYEMDDEKIYLEERAKQAELQAEAAAREVLQAKEEAERIRQEKQRELEALQVGFKFDNVFQIVKEFPSILSILLT